jgi:hypothetical protein
MSYNSIVVALSSLKPFFFNGLKKELCFSDNTLEHKTPESNKSVYRKVPRLLLGW